jgi:pullulanase/glycogen debranching enzyme
MKAGSPAVLGATFTGDGVNFAIQSRAATRVEVCLYDASGERETARLTLPGRTGAVHHGFVEQELARVGTLYGIRVYGAYDPREGYRFNGNKLLLDPWARDIVGDVKYHPSILGYDARDGRCRVAASSMASSTGAATVSRRCRGAIRSSTSCT